MVFDIISTCIAGYCGYKWWSMPLTTRVSGYTHNGITREGITYAEKFITTDNQVIKNAIIETNKEVDNGKYYNLYRTGRCLADTRFKSRLLHYPVHVVCSLIVSLSFYCAERK